MKLHSFLFFLLLSLCTQISADDKHSYNRINFSVSSEKEVENDNLVVILFASERGGNPQALAKTVNELISWGLAIAKKNDLVEVNTLNYSTNPEYKEGKVIAWRVKQAIQLKSKDSKTLSNLLGELQQKLKIESVQYQVSTELRKKTEEVLISEAMGKFKHRANSITQNLGRKGYRVVRLNVSNSFSARPFYPNAMMRGGYASSSRMPAPEIEAGKQKIVVNIQVEVELSEENKEN